MNGFEHYTAIVTMYLLSATAIVPIVGKLSDMYGRKPFLVAGVTRKYGWSGALRARRQQLQVHAL
jgi:MFS family permease